LGNLIVLLVLFLSACAPESGTVRRPTVRIGSTNFSEQIILAELYANALEANEYRVERKLRMGNREVVAPALEHGEIDMYVEYLATAERFFAGNASVASSNPATTHQALQSQLEHRGIAVLNYAPAVDQNGLVVTRATATGHRLQKTSDLAPFAGQMVLGGPPECPVRPFCQPGLERVYGIRFRDFRPLDPSGPMTVAALLRGDIQVAVLFTTDARIAERDLVLLHDDLGLQEADNIAPLVRLDLLTRAPADFKTTVNEVSARLTTPELTLLARRVDIDRREPREAAAAWLKAKRIVT
jgi:osmoprotectant transport system substrate-binding protein